MPSNGAPTVPTPRHALAWSVHLFTASGAVLGVFALWEIGRGGLGLGRAVLGADLRAAQVHLPEQDAALARRDLGRRHALDDRDGADRAASARRGARPRHRDLALLPRLLRRALGVAGRVVGARPARMSPPRGALLINLGTPDAPRPREVRRYLREFLHDPRVIDLPRFRRTLLVEGVILPTRPRRT